MHIPLLCSLLLTAPPRLLVVETDFPGGSAEVEIDQSERLIRLTPTAHKDRGWACWWYLRIDGITPGETITLDVGEAPWATPDRAAFSIDGTSWQQTAPGTRDGKRIVYQQPIDAQTAWFAWGPPFVPADADALVKAAARSPHAEAFVLCKTREGRDVPALRISEGDLPPTERRGIWIQARQHAWESGSSWVGKGFVDWVLSDTPEAQSLRRRSRIVFVPIMDIDNVHRGAGGKNQVPQDHNRDWSDQPHWRSVEAAQHGILEMTEAGGMDLFVDLHNPGADAREPYFYVVPDEVLTPAGRQNQAAFLKAAQTEMTGPLPFTGRTIESGSRYDANWQAISKNWVARHAGPRVVALTLETAWNTPHSTQPGYQQVGRELGKAIERYVRADPDESNPVVPARQ
jgi:hypothetical protein